MKFTEQHIKGVFIIEPTRFGDSRGYFSEVYKQSQFDEHIGNINFIQDNESLSSYGVLRGLHFQKGDTSQAKLVRVSQGTVLDVAVDLRPHSTTFGQHVAVELSADNARQLFIPRGFAHGFVVLSNLAQFQYKVDNHYSPQSEITLNFNDPDVAIDWLIDPSQMILSEKDKTGLSLADVKNL